MKEKIVLSGREDDLKAAITIILGLHQILEGMDIGQFVGMPLQEYVRPTPQPLKMTIFFFPVPHPPWKPRSPNPRYTVPFLDRSRINWQTIKEACGGKNGYNWGRFSSTVNLRHETGTRKMQVFGATAAEAEKRLERLLYFSEGEIVSKTQSEQEKWGMRVPGKPLYKEATRVYPGYMTIINQEKILRDEGRANLDGSHYLTQKVKLPLYTDQEPRNFKEQIAELLRKSD